jgi:thiol-disulfide isomerase/thioredoxin
MFILSFILTILIIVILFSNSRYSNFSGNEQKLGTTPEKEKANSIASDTVLIFYAPWCGYCKQAMTEFENARDASNGKVILINGDENRELMKKYGVHGFPTIMKGNKVYNGGRTEKEILEFMDE